MGQARVSSNDQAARRFVALTVFRPVNDFASSANASTLAGALFTAADVGNAICSSGFNTTPLLHRVSASKQRLDPVVRSVLLLAHSDAGRYNSDKAGPPFFPSQVVSKRFCVAFNAAASPRLR